MWIDSHTHVTASEFDADRPLVPGDYDASGVTNAADLAVFAGLFGLPITPGISADGDANGFVDGNDFLLWQRNFDATPPAIAATESASEPAAALQAGADYLVIGRPITASPDPAASLEKIMSEL